MAAFVGVKVEECTVELSDVRYPDTLEEYRNIAEELRTHCVHYTLLCPDDKKTELFFDPVARSIAFVKITGPDFNPEDSGYYVQGSDDVWYHVDKNGVPDYQNMTEAEKEAISQKISENYAQDAAESGYEIMGSDGVWHHVDRNGVPDYPNMTEAEKEAISQKINGNGVQDAAAQAVKNSDAG